MATMVEFWEQVKNTIDKFSLVQKISLSALTLALIITFVVIMSWASKPQYGVLFSNLNEKDAGRIVDELKSNKVPYKFDSGGTTILVPEPEVYEQRMQFANMGLPQEGIVGYELFDQTKLGMTDFVQKLNYHRALEGELSRTLSSISEIYQARVHIVIPKPALFEEDKKPTTASIAIRTKGDGLSKGQIQGIANLVASSVEGLTPENITVIDSRGNILSGDLSKDESVALSASQHDLQRQVEKYLEEKAQSMMVGALGMNRSIIRVTAELDFNKIEKTEQKFDPESQVVRSEEISTKTGGTNSQSQNPTPGSTNTNTSNDETENTITNYEISNTIEHVVNSVGTIGRLSVAVLVDGKYEAGETDEGEEVRNYIERTPEELNKLSSIVQNAIGYNTRRGDQISISSFPFDTTRETELLTEFSDAARYEFWRDMIEKATAALIGVALLLAVRSLIRRSKQLGDIILPKTEVVTKAARIEEDDEESYEDEAERARAKIRKEMNQMERSMAADSVQKEEMMKRISSFVQENPQEASNLIKTWLYEEETI